MRRDEESHNFHQHDNNEELPMTKPIEMHRKFKCYYCTILFLSLLFILPVIVGIFFVFNHGGKSYPNEMWKHFQQPSYAPPKLSVTNCKHLYDEIGPLNDTYKKQIKSEVLKSLYDPKWNSKTNEPSAIEKAREAYQRCKETYYVAENITNDVFKIHSGKSVIESITFLIKEFNFDTFFHLEIMPNMGEGRFMSIYVMPNPAFYEEPKSLIYTGINEPGLSLFNKLRNISEFPNDTQKWKIMNFETSKDFNFTGFFGEILKNQSNDNLEKFEFVVTNPDYVQKLGEVLSETTPQAMRSLFLPALMKSLNTHDCESIIEEFMPHIATVLYLSKQNETEIQEVRDRVLEDFQKLIEKVKVLIQPYLHTEKQQKLAKEKLDKVGLTTEAPNWLQLDDSLDRLNSAYKDLTLHPSIMDLRKFAFQKQLSKLISTHEALRSFEFDSIPMSSMEIYYSEMGNWLTIPIAAFLESNSYSSEAFILDIARNIVKIVAFDAFQWTSLGTQRNLGSDILPLDLKEQEKCFQIHGISELDYSLSLGLDAARSLLSEKLSGIEKRHLTNKLAKLVLAENTTSSRRIAAGFLERHNENLCKLENVLPCFL